ncbi:MAG: hypothetical protein EA360_03260 [Balneolaceae bacterium]|nr:MAG: hypothetical protein EA360_03260 [Balneolaceae bacterium]
MRNLLNHFKAPLILLDQAVFSGTSFLVTILLARTLSLEDFGVYAGLVLVLYLITSLISAFVVQPLQVNLPSSFYKIDYLSFTFWFQLALSTFLITWIPLLLMLPFDLIAQHKDLALPAILISAGFVMHDYYRKRFLAEDRVTDTFLLDLQLMAAHLLAAGYLLIAGSASLVPVLFLLALGYLPSFLTGLIFSKPTWSGIEHWPGFLKLHLNEGKWLFYTALVQWWGGNLFVVASGFFLGAAALGALRLVQSVFGVLNVLFQTFENYVLPQTASRLHKSMDEGRRFLWKIGGQSLFAVSLLLLILFIFSDFIIVLAGGEQFREYGFLVKGMALLYALIFTGYPIRIAIRALVMNKIFFKGYLLTFLFGLLSSYLLLSFFQLTGAIAGLIFSQLILLIYWQSELQKKHFLLWK